MIQLRPYRSSDFNHLLKIDRACFAEGISYSEDEMEYFLGLPSAVRVVAEKEDTVVGFVIAAPFRAGRSRQVTGRIITIDILEKERSRGLGSRLLAAAEAELKAAGCGQVRLEVAVDNFEALRFYQKYGYAKLKVLPRYYLDSIDALLMGKPL